VLGAVRSFALGSGQIMCSRHAGEVSLDTELLSVDPRVTLRAVEGNMISWTQHE